jgi:hypothetical protein
MRLMALKTFRDFPVSLVAGGAEQFRMKARMFFCLFALLRMTGEAGGSEVCSKFHLEGGVRVGMTGVASADLIVGLAGMAGAAEWNNLFLAHHGRMSLMAARACNGCFVLCTLAVNHSLDTCMALNAVSVQEFCRRFCGLFLCTEREEESGNNEQEKWQYKFQPFSVEDCAVIHHSLPPFKYL